MTYPTLDTYAIESGTEIFMCYVNDVTSGLFMSFLFLSIWLILTLGNFFITKKMTGSGDFPVSMTVGSLPTFVFSVLMRLVTCSNLPLTSDLNLGVIIGVTLLSVLFLFNSRD